MTMEEDFNYRIDEGFAWSEVNLKGSRKYYVEGYASTIDEDKAGEIIGMQGQERLLSQLKSENITLDLEHEEWYDPDGNILARPKNTKIPIAKVVSAELRERGVWVKAEINPHIPSFKSVWNSIKDGFLKAFSIAFYPIAKAGKVISDLNLVNITLTGSPVNTAATFNAVMKSAKAYLDIKKLEENTMTEKDIKKEEIQPEIKAEEEVKVEPEAQPEEVKEVEEEKKEEVNPLEAEVKALREKLEEQNKAIAELKAELEKPVMKSVKEEAPEVPKEEQVYVSPLGLIN